MAKKLISAAFAVLLIIISLPFYASASDGFSYVLSSDGKSYSISSYKENEPEISIPGTYNGLPVNKICFGAFSGNVSVYKIIIPESITQIEPGAFIGLPSLCEFESTGKYTSSDGVLYTDNGKTLFSYPQALSGSFTVPGNITYIAGYAFYGSSLSGILIQSGLLNIGDYAFSSSSVSSAVIPESVKTVGRSAFSGSLIREVTVPGGASVGEFAFAYCKDLVYADISSCTQTGEGLFTGCTKLTAVSYSNAVVSIPAYAFSGCTAIITAPIPSNIKSIGAKAFADCIKLENVSYKENVSVSSNAFEGCGNLSEINNDPPVSISAPYANLTLRPGEKISPDVMSSSDYDLFSFSDNIRIEGKSIYGIYEGEASVYAVAVAGGGTIKLNVTVSEGAAVLESEHPYSPGVRPFTYTVRNAERIAVTFSSSTALVYGDMITIYDKNYNVYGNFGGSELSGKTIFIDGDTVNLRLDSVKGGAYGFSVISVKNVNDLKKVSSVILPEEISLDLGENTSLGARVLPADAFPADLVYVSADSSVAVIDSSGNIYAAGVGSTVITVYSSYYGVKAECVVNVNGSIYNGFIYESDGNGAVITGYAGTSLNPVIPSVIDGNKVTAIGNGAFAYSGIKSVTIPEFVTAVAPDAFYGCSSMTEFKVDKNNKNFSVSSGILLDSYGSILLKVPCGLKETVKIPNGVSVISYYAFDHCYYVKTVDLNNLSYFNAEGFKYCDNITNFICGKSPYVFENGTLYSSDKKTIVFCISSLDTETYTVNDGVVSVSDFAFMYNPHIKKIVLGKNVLSIGNKAFNYIGSLETIEVSPSNAKFTSSDGILYENDSILKRVPPSYKKSVSIPDTITEISPYAFAGCSGIVSITIPSGVVKIGDGAFSECVKLKYAVFPEAVATVGKNVFSGCVNASVYIPADMKLSGKEDCTVFSGAGSDAIQSCLQYGTAFGYAYQTGGDQVLYTEINKSTEIHRITDNHVLSKIDILTNSLSFEAYEIYGAENNIKLYTGKTVAVADIASGNAMIYNSGAFYPPEKYGDIVILDPYDVIVILSDETTEQASLTVKTLPNKLKYGINDAFDDEGLTLYYTGACGMTELIEDGWFVEYDFSSSGVKEVIINYEGCEISINVTVSYDKISGTVSITGNCVYGQTLTCDTSEVRPADAELTCQWNRDGNPVSGAVSGKYSVTAADIGHMISVSVTAVNGYTGTLTSNSIKAGKAARAAPPAPVAAEITSVSITLKPVDGCEYRLSGQSGYSDNYKFSGLDPDTTYVIYQRYKETAVTYASAVTNISVKTLSNDKLGSKVYKINEANRIISLVEPGTTVTDLLKNFDNQIGVRVFKNNSEITGTAYAGTGCEVRLYDGSTLRSTYYITVTGDVNGDGKVGMTDYLQIKERIIKNKTLDKPNEYACDINGDGKITMTDYLRLKYCIQGHETLIQNEY